MELPVWEGIMGMFTVLEMRGPLLKLAWWDFDDKELDNVYLEDGHEPSIEVGSVHMMELVLRGGLLKVGFCSPAYDEVVFDEDLAENVEPSSE
jgi:hypothetical protein